MSIRTMYGGGAYLKAVDLGDDEIQVNVDDVLKEESFGKEQYVLVFGKGEGARKLGLNKTNALVMADTFGDSETDSLDEIKSKWVGKTIFLYAADTQTPEGTPTKGVRIRTPKATKVGFGNKPSASDEVPV